MGLLSSFTQADQRDIAALTPGPGQVVVGGPNGPVAVTGSASPARSLAEILDPVAADHTADVKAAFAAYPHWHIPKGMTVKLTHGTFADNACVVLDEDATLTGADRETSIIQITDTPANNWTYAVFRLAGPSPRQKISDLAMIGPATTPMTWTNGQRVIFYENSANADGLGGQGIIRPQPVIMARVRVSAYDGQPLHTEYARAHVLDSDFVDLGNGVNLNGSGGVVARCFFQRAEGVEGSGSGVAVLDNIYLDAFNTAASVGGYFTAGHPEFAGARVIGNRVYGCSGNVISVAESMGDALIAFNYIERAGGDAIHNRITDAYLTNGATILGNHIVSWGNGTGGYGISSESDNARILANRIMRRADHGSIANRKGMMLSGANGLVDGNLIDMANITGGPYAVDIRAGASNLTWGTTNRILNTPSQIYDFLINAAATFADARNLGWRTRTIAGGATTLYDSDRTCYLDPNGANRIHALPSAAGKFGKRLFVLKTDATAFTNTLDPAGTETINGATTKTLGSQYATLELESDGTNWVIVNQLGTVT